MSNGSNRDIVYLFGAGASALCIPPSAFLIRAFKENNIPVPVSTKDTALPIAKAIRDYSTAGANDSERYASPDTHAKLLSVRGDASRITDVKLLTETAIVTMEARADRLAVLTDHIDGRTLWRQEFMQADPRYLNWLLSISAPSDHKLSLPNNVTVLTWNYDSGLAWSLHQYFGSWEPVMEYFDHSRVDGFSVMPLNGSVASRDPYRLHFEKPDSELEHLDWLRRGWENRSIRPSPSEIYEPIIRFAWELPEDDLERTRKQIEHAESLVVIGYSFPNFNAHIDHAILDAARELRTIYVQTHRPDESRQIAELLRIRLQEAGRKVALGPNDRGLRIVEIGSAAQFFVPPKLHGIRKISVSPSGASVDRV